MYATGTVECICSVFDSFQLTQETVDNNVCCYPSCINGLYASLGFNFTGGSLLKWYRDTFAAANAATPASDMITVGLTLSAASLANLREVVISGAGNAITLRP